jgi:hypothetical protein
MRLCCRPAFADGSEYLAMQWVVALFSAGTASGGCVDKAIGERT